MRQNKRFTCSAILFDMDGVLLDSSSNVRRRWTEWAIDHGLNTDEVIRLTNGYSTQQIVQTFFDGKEAQREVKRMDASAATDLDGVEILPGAKVLNCLPEHMRAVVTSASRDTAIARLIHVGLQVPDVLVASDDVGNMKPSPEPYQKALVMLEMTPGDALVVEDSEVGIRSADSANLQAICINGAERESHSLLLENSSCVHVVRFLSEIEVRVEVNKLVIRY